MSKIRSMMENQASVGEPERRGDERSETPRSGGSSTLARADVPSPPDSEVLARHRRRRFTPTYKLEILRKVEACARHGELGALLRREGLYLVAHHDVASAARGRVDAEDPRTEGGGRRIPNSSGSSTSIAA